MLKSLKINTSNEKWNEPLHPLQNLNGHHLMAVKFLWVRGENPSRGFGERGRYFA